MTQSSPIFFETPADFREWFEQNASSETELVVGFRKKGTGLPSMTWPESVDEALCVGWIDGVRKRIDDEAYQIRFTPRKPGSIWSAINIERVRVLTEEGRITPDGLAAFALRSEERSRTYCYEQSEMADLESAREQLFRAEPEAWEFFNAQPPGYRKQQIWRIVSAKQEGTRNSRLAKLIEASRESRRL